MFSTISIEHTHQDQVARITLERPDKHNALNAEMIRELYEAAGMLGAEKSVRVVQMTGRGKSFSAGADLNWMKSALEMSRQQNEDDALKMAEMFEALAALPKPLLVLVNGATFGGGVGLTACGDIVLAAKQAVFSLSEVKLGLTPATISPFVLRAMGERQTMRYMLSAERFDAETAKQTELVHEVADSVEKLEEKAEEITQTLLGNAPGAMANVKTLIRVVRNKDFDKKLQQETARRIADERTGEEGQEGIKSFFEKRNPNWVKDA